MTPIPTVRAFLAGDSGSGKSTRAYNLYLKHFPRIIVIDTLGEWTEFALPDGRVVRADEVVTGLAEMVDVVRRRARHGKFFISAYLDGDGEFEELVDWMVPLGNRDDSPALIMGGCALLVDEVDVYARNRGSPPQQVRTLYRRSRHVGLSVISATQRPGNVSKEVTAQSTNIIAHRLHEPADRDYLVSAMRWSRSEEDRWLDWCRRHPHGAIWKDVQTGRHLALPESGPPQPWRPAQTELPFARAEPLADGHDDDDDEDDQDDQDDDHLW